MKLLLITTLITFAWDAVPEPWIKGYRLFEVPDTGAPVKVADTTYTNATIDIASTVPVHYGVKAVNLSDVESAMSALLLVQTGPAPIIAQGPGATITVRIPSLTTGAPYAFDFTAYDAAQTKVPFSITYGWDPVEIPMAAPGNVRKSAQVPVGSFGWTATVAWDGVNDATGYRVDYGTASGKYTKTLSVSTNSVSISALGRLSTYYLAVVSLGTGGKISAPSPELKLTFTP